MENVSKALIIAGEMLLAIMVLALVVYLFSGASNFSHSYQSIKDNEEIDQFNKNFEKYMVANKDYNIRDIVTVINIARNYNSKQRDPVNEYINVVLNGKNYANIKSFSDEQIIEKMQEILDIPPEEEEKTYKVDANSITYFQDGRLHSISYQ